MPGDVPVAGAEHRPDLHRTGARIEELLDGFRSTAPPEVAERVEELVALLVELYGAGLGRVVELLGAEPGRDAMLRRLAADDLVASLLVLHDLHPDDTVTRVRAALDQVRPYLGSHAGGVELLEVDASGVVRLRLSGSCDGCPSSLVTVRTAIERAIEEAAPEVTAVEVEGLVDPARPAGEPQLLHLAPPPPRAAAGTESAGAQWVHPEPPVVLADGASTSIEPAGTPVVVCRVAGTLYAYRDRCPRCAATLGGVDVPAGRLACPGCGEAFDVRLAGRGADGLHLDPLPLLGDADDPATVRIAVPGAALPAGSRG